MSHFSLRGFSLEEAGIPEEEQKEDKPAEGGDEAPQDGDTPPENTDAPTDTPPEEGAAPEAPVEDTPPEPEKTVDVNPLTHTSETDRVIALMKEGNKSGTNGAAYAKGVEGVLQTSVEEDVDISGGGGSSSSSSSDSSDDSSGDSDSGGDSGGGDDMGMDFDFGDDGSGDDASGDADPTDDADGGGDDESDGDSDPVQSPDGEDKEDKKSTAQESFRSIRIDLPRQQRRRRALAQEMALDIAEAMTDNEIGAHRTDRVFLDEEPLGHKLVNWAGNKIANGLSWLKDMGIQYGPQVLKFLGEAIVTTATETARLVITGAEKLRRFAHKKMNSFESSKKSLEEMKTKLEHYLQNAPKAVAEGHYTNEKHIATLKIGSNAKVLDNVKSMTKFTNNTLIGLSSVIDGEVQTMLHIMELDATSNKHNLPTMLRAADLKSILKEGKVTGYEPKDSNLRSYMSEQLGMGDIRVIAHVPDHRINNIKDIKTAYSHSAMFLGIDLSSTKGVASIEFLDAKQLGALIDALIVFTDACIKQVDFYKQTDTKLNTFGNKFKMFFGSMVNAKDNTGANDMTLKGTTMEYVYMKLGFVNKVYLPCAMDIHDYNIKVLHSAISYASANMSALKEH